MHTCGTHRPLVPWHMQPTEAQERRVLLCPACGKSEIVLPRGPLHAETLDYRSSLAKLLASGAGAKGRAAAARTTQ